MSIAPSVLFPMISVRSLGRSLPSSARELLAMDADSVSKYTGSKSALVGSCGQNLIQEYRQTHD
jgi:hypothetical protein